MKHNKYLSYSLITFLLIVTYIPIISVMFFSFNSIKSVTHFEGFSLMWYQELVQNEEIRKALYITIGISVVSTIVSTILGTLGAIMISKSNKKFREFVLTSNNIPVVNPEIVTAIAMFLIFYAFSLSPGLVSMLLAHIAFSTPYVLIAVYPKMKSLDPSIMDAASDLGAKPYQAFRKVLIPELKPSIIAGAAIAFTMSFDDYVISKFVTEGNGEVFNISQYLHSKIRFGVSPVVNALSTVIVLVVGIKILLDIFKFRKIKLEED